MNNSKNSVHFQKLGWKRRHYSKLLPSTWFCKCQFKLPRRHLPSKEKRDDIQLSGLNFLLCYSTFCISTEMLFFISTTCPDYFRQISLVKIVTLCVCRRNFITWGDCWHFSSSLHELQQGKKSKSLLFSVLSPPLNNLKLQCGKWVVSGKVRVDWSLFFFHCKISCCCRACLLSEDLGTVGVIRITGSNTASLSH